MVAFHMRRPGSRNIPPAVIVPPIAPIVLNVGANYQSIIDSNGGGNTFVFEQGQHEILAPIRLPSNVIITGRTAYGKLTSILNGARKITGSWTRHSANIWKKAYPITTKATGSTNIQNEDGFFRCRWPQYIFVNHVPFRHVGAECETKTLIAGTPGVINFGSDDPELVVGDEVKLTSISGITGITNGTIYEVVSSTLVSGNYHVVIRPNGGGSSINFTGANATTISSGSITASSLTGTQTLNVGSASTFSSSGIVTITTSGGGQVKVSHAGKTSTTITGCDLVSGTGSLTIAAGNAVSQDRQAFVDVHAVAYVNAVTSSNDEYGRFYHDTVNDEIYIWRPSDNDPGATGELVEYATTKAAFYATSAGASNVSINNLIVEKFANIPMSGSVGDSGQNCHNWIIQGCELRLNTSSGIAGSEPNLIAIGNKVYSNGNAGVRLHGAHNAQIAYNRFYDNAKWSLIRPGWSGAGIKIGGETDGLKIFMNYAYDNAGNGIWFDVHCTGDNPATALPGTPGVTEIWDNLSWSNRAQGIFYEVSDNGYIHHNKVWNNGTDNLSGWLYRSQIFISTSARCRVEYNTVLVPRDSGDTTKVPNGITVVWQPRNPPHVDEAAEGAINNIVKYNDIYYWGPTGVSGVGTDSNHTYTVTLQVNGGGASDGTVIFPNANIAVVGDTYYFSNIAGTLGGVNSSTKYWIVSVNSADKRIATISTTKGGTPIKFTGSSDTSVTASEPGIVEIWTPSKLNVFDDNNYYVASSTEKHWANKSNTSQTLAGTQGTGSDGTQPPLEQNSSLFTSLPAISPLQSPIEPDNSIAGYCVSFVPQSTTNVDLVLARLRRSGAKAVRTDLLWPQWQPTNPTNAVAGQNDTIDNAVNTYYNRYLQGLQDAGIKLVAMCGYTPAWARPGYTTNPNGANDKIQPTRDIDNDCPDYANFVWLAVDYIETRYPGLLLAVEIWNEPNLTPFWATPPDLALYDVGGDNQPDYSPDPRRYAELMRGAWNAIKFGQVSGRPDRAARPGVRLIGGGSAAGGAGGSPASDGTFASAHFNRLWFEWTSHTHFDGIAYHPYMWGYDVDKDVNWNHARNMREEVWPLLKEYGRTDAKFWSTEWGIPTRRDAAGQGENGAYKDGKGGWEGLPPTGNPGEYRTSREAMSYTEAMYEIPLYYEWYRSSRHYDASIEDYFTGPLFYYCMNDLDDGIGSDWRRVSTIAVGASNNSDDIIRTTAAHNLAVGDEVDFSVLNIASGTLNIDIYTGYYVISSNFTANTLQISTSLNGSAVNFGTNITSATMHKVGPDVYYKYFGAHEWGSNEYNGVPKPHAALIQSGFLYR